MNHSEGNPNTVKALSISKDQLVEAGRLLSTSWHASLAVWSDSAQIEFEARYWIECEATTTSCAERLQDIVNTLSQAENAIP